MLTCSNFKFLRLYTNKFIIRLCLVVLMVACQASSYAQDSSHIRIALLTCTPGEELYSTFGHTAIRVTDSNSVADNVFNYGTFNFEEPGFYTKFIRGKLRYYLSVENFEDFKYAYQVENRGITEQVLQMTATEKIALMQALYANAKEPNKFYQYDFFLDNCTTRARDMLVKFKNPHPVFKPVMPTDTRFRQAIHQYLDRNEKYWSKLGIDLLLGQPTDAVMTTGQSQFLPDNLMNSFDSSNSGSALILFKASLYPLNRPGTSTTFLTPMVVFTSLLIIIVSLSFSTSKRVQTFLQGFDGIFFFITGAMGLLLIFMWVGTDHSMTKNNYNLLWAWPINVVSAFFVNTHSKQARVYFGCSAVALILVLLSWHFLPQQLNNALLPLVIMLAFRSAFKYWQENKLS